MTFNEIQKLFLAQNNGNDIVTLVDFETDEVFRTCKIKELNRIPRIRQIAYGFASRHFSPKENQFVDGFFIYCKRAYVI